MGRERLVVLDSFAADQGTLGWERLAALGELTVYPRTTPEERLERAVGATALFTNKVPIDARVMGALTGLRYIGIQATGTDCVDLREAKRRGVAVTHVADYSTASVAQFVFASLLHFFHDVAAHAASVREGAWARSPDFCFFRQPLHELAGKRIAIVGLGAIGSAVARIAKGFGMDPVAVQLPWRPEPSTSDAICIRLPLAEALAQADVVSLHCPLSEESAGLVDDAFLACCKRGAILINSARGALVDEAALLRALEEGRIGAAALDVLAEEPAREGHPLVEHPRVLVTPHMAWGTEEARRRLISEVSANYEAFLRGEVRNRVA